MDETGTRHWQDRKAQGTMHLQHRDGTTHLPQMSQGQNKEKIGRDKTMTRKGQNMEKTEKRRDKTGTTHGQARSIFLHHISALPQLQHISAQLQHIPAHLQHISAHFNMSHQFQSED